MKNSISKVALLLLCSVFSFSSCSKDTVTVTEKYRISVNADTDYLQGQEAGAIADLYAYTKIEMEKVDKAYGKDLWSITETAATETEASAACDRKAIAMFEENLSAINIECASVKAKFDTKKAELLSKISLESNKTHVIYSNYGGHLRKYNAATPFMDIIIKQGQLFNFQAIGGEK